MDKEYTMEELIDLYIADALSADDKAAFERRMQEDENLAKEVMLARHIANAVERKGEKAAFSALSSFGSVEELKTQLNNTERKHRNKISRRVRMRWVTGISAAAVVGFVLILGFQPRYSAQKLFEMYYTQPSYDPVVSRGGEEIDSLLKQTLDRAAKLYEIGNMQGAVAEYDSAVLSFSLHEFPDDALFYRAVALAETGRPAEALAGFAILSSNADSEYSEDAQWQAALLYICLGERREARAALDTIVREQGIYSTMASELLVLIKQKRIF